MPRYTVYLSFLVYLSLLEFPRKLNSEFPSFPPLNRGKQETGIKDKNGKNFFVLTGKKNKRKDIFLWQI